MTSVAPAVETGPAATQVLASPPAPGPTTEPTQAFTPGSGGPMPWAPTQPGAATGTLPSIDEDDDETTSRPWVMWVLIGVAVLAVAGIVWLLMSQRGPEGPEMVQVPAVQGMTQEEAVSKLASVNLRAKILTEPHETIEAGLATRTDPPASEEVEADSEVDLYISSRPDTLEVPDVEGETQSGPARSCGMRVSTCCASTSRTCGLRPDVAVGTDPPAGSTVNVGDWSC